MTLLPKVTSQLDAAGLAHCVVIAGGIIPREDADVLTQQHGVDAIFGPGTNTEDIVTFIRATVAERRGLRE
jgi:methylmalonyl-CoA mutase cobalamin-binding domain/chain